MRFNVAIPRSTRRRIDYCSIPGVSRSNQKTSCSLSRVSAPTSASRQLSLTILTEIVPSSARSTASPAIQLPSHLVPLLAAPLERLKTAVDAVVPPSKTRTSLEDAEYEEEEGQGFEQHLMVQCESTHDLPSKYRLIYFSALDKLRIFRPRILVHGSAGMGQAYLGPAVLHHLEAFHVQSLDLGSLMGDSTRVSSPALQPRVF